MVWNFHKTYINEIKKVSRSFKKGQRLNIKAKNASRVSENANYFKK